MRSIITLILVNVSAAFGLPDIAAPCTCRGVEIPEAVESADAVFAGFVAQLDTIGSGTVTVTISVYSVWKGLESESLVVETFMTTCGYPFVLGEEYLVYAIYPLEGRELYTNICKRTRPVKAAAEDLEALDSPDWEFQGYSV